MTENKLYITNIPRHIKEAELNKVFENFGKIERLYLCPDKRYLLLWYNNKRSCEEAIKDLHGKPPYNMNVSMAKIRSMSVQFTVDERTYYDKFNNKVTAYVDVNGEVYVPLSKVDGIRAETKDGSQSFDSQPNSLIITVNNNARSVSEHGSKFDPTLRNKTMNEQTSNNKNYRKWPYFRKNFAGNNSKENVTPKPKTPDSRNWNKKEQNENDDLSNKTAAETNSPSSNNVIDSKRNTNSEKVMAPVKFFRKQGPASQFGFRSSPASLNDANNKHTSPKKFGSPVNVSQQNTDSMANQPSTPTSSKSSFGRRGDFKLEPHKNKTMDSKTPNNYGQTSNNTKEYANNTNKIVQNEKIYDPKNPPYKFISLKTNKEFTLVDVQVVVSPVRAWVTIANNEEENNYLMAVLDFIPTAKIVEPEVGLMCLAMYDGTWFRACVMKTSPEVLVKFIDYGNDVTVSPTDKLLELPQKLCDKPALAVQIELLDGAPVKITHEQQYIAIKPVNIVDNIVYVKVKHGLYDNETPVEKNLPVSKNNAKFKEITDALFAAFQPGKNGIFGATHKLSEDKILVYVVYYDLLSLVQDLESVEAEPDATFKPNVGDVVLCFDEKWKRGLIVEVFENSYEIAILDYGTVKILKHIARLTDNVSSIPVCSAVATIKNNIDAIMNDEDIEFTIKTIKNGKVTVVLENGSEVIFEAWDPFDPLARLDLVRPCSVAQSMKPSNSTNQPAKQQNSSNSSVKSQNLSNSSVKSQNSLNSSEKPQNSFNSSAKHQNPSISPMQSKNSSVKSENCTSFSSNQSRRPQNASIVAQSLESKNVTNTTQDKQPEVKTEIKNPVKTRKTLEKMKLRDGEGARLVSEVDGYLYVRNKSSNLVLKNVLDFMQNVKIYESLKTTPIAGDLVAAEYEGSWYRALVKGIRKSEAFIYYIDYGNSEYKSFDCLGILPEQLFDFPETLIKIKLNGVDRRFTEDELEFFELVSTYKKLLTVEIIDESKNVVELYFKNREKLSEQAKNFDRETLSVGTENSNEFTYNNVSSGYLIQIPDITDPPIMYIKTQKVPLGKLDIKYLSEMDLSYGLISFTLYQSDLYAHVMGEFSDTLHTYCEKIAPGEAYFPKLEEIVLAKYDGKWARGLVMENISEFESSIFMVDFGVTKTIELAHIRKMPKEFAEYDALASLGVIEDIPDEPSNQYLARLEELLSSAEKHEVIVRSQNSETESYTVAFPAIQALLKKENLL